MPQQISSSFWDRFAFAYDAFELISTGVFRRLNRLIREDASPARRVLELGAGTGKITLALAPYVESVDCTDRSRPMLRKARRKARQRGCSNVRFCVQDICALRLPRAAYDAVIAANVLHLLPRPDKALQEMRGVLKPGGLLILPTFVLGDAGLSGKILIRLIRFLGFDGRSAWTSGQYRAFLEENGLHLRSFQRLGGPIPLAYACAVVP